MSISNGSPLHERALGREDVKIGDDIVVFSADSGEYSRGTVVAFYDEPGILNGSVPKVILKRADGHLAHHQTQAIGLDSFAGGNWGKEFYVLSPNDASPSPKLIPRRLRYNYDMSAI